MALPGVTGGCVPLTVLGSLPEIKAVLPAKVSTFPQRMPAVPMPPQGTASSWISNAIKACKSEIVKLHFSGQGVMRMPLSERLNKSVARMFHPSTFYLDLHLQQHVDGAGFVPLDAILSHPDVSYLKLGAPAQRNACITALNSCKPHLHNVAFRVDDDDRITGIKCLPLSDILRRQVEFMFTPKNRSKDPLMRKLWLQASDDDGWVPASALLAVPYVRSLVHGSVATFAEFLRSSAKLTVGQGSDPPQFFVRPADYKPDTDDDSTSSDSEKNTAATLHPLSAPAINAAATANVSAAAHDDDDDDDDEEAESSPASDVEERVTKSWSVTAPALDDTEFSVMTWNVLADALATPEMFDYADAEHLRFKHRLPLILETIAAVKPSILCMQEVQVTTPGDKANHFDHYKQHLHGLGYRSLLVKRIGRLSGKLANAVFWDNSFELLESQRVEFRIDLKAACKAQGPAAAEYFARLNQVAVLLALKHTQTSRIVLVACTHISAAWKTPAKQLAQVQVCLDRIDAFAADLAAKHGARPAVLFVGDLNNGPKSATYELCTTGAVDPEHVPATDVPGVSMPLPLRHDLGLSSAYVSVTGSEPEATNVKSDYADVLDYIFHDAKLNATEVMAVPSVAECRVHGGLPDASRPSDHLPISAKFTFA